MTNEPQDKYEAEGELTVAEIEAYLEGDVAELGGESLNGVLETLIAYVKQTGKPVKLLINIIPNPAVEEDLHIEDEDDEEEE